MRTKHKTTLFKRLGAWALTLALVVGLLPTVAFANEINADITIDDLASNHNSYYTYDITQDTVIDLSSAANAEDTANLYLNLNTGATPVTVTVKGNPDNLLNLRIWFQTKYQAETVPNATLVLENVNITEWVYVTVPDGGQYTLQYRGNVTVGEIRGQKSDENSNGTLTISGEENDTLTVTKDINNAQNLRPTDLIINGGTLNTGNIGHPHDGSSNYNNRYKTETISISDCTINFQDKAGLCAKTISINGAKLQNTGYIYAYRIADINNSPEAANDFKDSKIEIKDSEIFFKINSNSGNLRQGMLGRAETITITDSVIQGDTRGGNNDSVGIGTIFKTLTIDSSTINVVAGESPAIGLNYFEYKQLKDTSYISADEEIAIRITNGSKVNAESTYSAAIGLPYNIANSSAQVENPPDLHIYISGDETEVNAISGNAAAIGGAGKRNTGSGGVDIVVPGTGGWNDSGTGSGNDGNQNTDNTGGSSTDTDNNQTPEEQLAASIADSKNLTDNVTLTIEGKPTVNAMSGVLAVYAKTVTCNDTNLVQETLLTQQSATSDTYSLRKAAADGVVTVGEDSLGTIKQNYASVASTKFDVNTDAVMQFGTEVQMNVLNESTEFKTAQTGWQQFFTKEAPTYSVQFDSNGGAGTMSTVQVAHGKYILPECVFTAPDGKVFAGWSYEQGGTAIPTDFITVNKALTLFAVWADKAGVSVTIVPDTVSVEKGKTQQFTAKVIGISNQSVTWSVEDNLSPETTIDANGVLTVALGETAASLTVKAVSNVNNSVHGTAVVTVTTHQHSVTQTLQVDATCATDGKKAYYTCQTCGKHFEDESGNTEIKDLDRYGIIAATGHSWSKPVWSWSADHTSATATFTCLNDSAHTETVVAAVSSVTAEATCTEKGTITYTAAASFNGKDYTAIKVTDSAPATGHTYGAWVSNDDGTHTRTCSVSTCGATEKENCSFVWATDKEATATQAGSKHEECTVCGYKKAAVEIPATGTPEEPTGNEQTGGNQTGDKDSPDTGKSDSPQTGDSSNIALWIALALISGAALAGTCIFGRRKKYSR